MARQVTVDGETRRLPDLFLLLATENPDRDEGTFLLPEAQVDRFFLKASLGYPGSANELKTSATSDTAIRSERPAARRDRRRPPA